MAYWGEAMTYHQTLWGNENVDAGRQALARLAPTPAARRARARTAKEQALLDAASVLFGEGDADGAPPQLRGSHGPAPRARARGSGRRLVLRAGAARDDEPQPHRHRRRARGAQPGAGGKRHPEARRGDSRRRPARAPAASGSAPLPAFTTTTIRRTRGWRWRRRARWRGSRPTRATRGTCRHTSSSSSDCGTDAAAADRARSPRPMRGSPRKGLPPAMRNYHALQWLQYELLQLGRYREARATIDELAPVVKATGNVTLLSDLSSMRARYVIETASWPLMAAESNFGNAYELFAIGMSAARSRNRRWWRRASCRRSVSARRIRAKAICGRRSPSWSASSRRSSHSSRAGRRGRRGASRGGRRREPAAGAARTAGADQTGAGTARRGAGRNRPTGGGDCLFRSGAARHPNRSLSVLGLARAAAAAGQRGGVAPSLPRSCSRTSTARTPICGAARSARGARGPGPAEPVLVRPWIVAALGSSPWLARRSGSRFRGAALKAARSQNQKKGPGFPGPSRADYEATSARP